MKHKAATNHTTTICPARLRAAAALLAVSITVTSLPQTGTHSRAAVPDAANPALLPSVNITEDIVCSFDGTDPETNSPAHTALAENRDTALYPTDTTLGYSLTDMTLSPTAYSAHFLADITSQTMQYPSSLTVLYTTDSSLSFFPNATQVSEADVSDAGFHAVSLKNGIRQINNRDTLPYLVRLEGDLIADNDQPLTPDTRYYYRIAYKSSSEYYFLTAPGQFTTTSPIETSAVRITSLRAESVGYNSAKIFWTVENPNQEYIYSHFLTVAGYAVRIPAEHCRDESGNDIPGQYYAVTGRLGETAQPKLEVYTGASSPTVITPAEPLPLEPADISQASFEPLVKPGVYNAALQLSVTPWYELDILYAAMFYRARGTETWHSKTFSTRPAAWTTISGLSAGTEYEYYILLGNGNYHNSIPEPCLASVGSESEPLTFSTLQLEAYEDSVFPDDAFRTLLKKELGISDNDAITNDALSGITRLSWWRRDNETPIRSLEGIGRLINLRDLYLDNHAFTDADEISTLTSLQTISLDNNELTKLPDLSAMTNLSSADFNSNKILSGFTADKLPAAFLDANPSWLDDTFRTQRYPVNTPDQAAISAWYAQYPYDMTLPNTYAVKPSVKSPYAPGRLSDESLDNALTLVNFARYVAGVRSNVVLNESYTEMAQAGALVNAVNNVMTHSPKQPADFPDDLFELAYSGCARSNIARGYSPLSRSIVDGWLFDSDSSNIDRVGHRRWILDPRMTATGFGAVDSYSNMYVVQGVESMDDGYISDFVAWPAQNMPVELMISPLYAWSVDLGTDFDSNIDASAVKLTLKNMDTGKSWSFDQETSDLNNNYFSVSGNCIIFRPNTSQISYQSGSRFEVSISGLKDRFGQEKPLSYTVNFFAMNKQAAPDVSIRLSRSSLTLSPGQSETLSAILTPQEDPDHTVSWSSSKPGVAAVDENGTVTAIAPGDAVITASYKGKSAACKVAVRDYSIDRTELQFDLARSAKPETLTISDGVNTVTDVTWHSTDESVAAVAKQNGCGIVTPKGSGTAQIQARIKDGPSFICTVTVTKDILTSISLNTQACSLEKGASRQLKVYFVPHDTTLSKETGWTSDNPDVASVDALGTVSANSRGTAVITASVNTNTGALTARCTVTVTETAEPASDNIPSGLQALTNVQTRLSDVSLKDYEGWEWENGDIALSQFAGMQEKSFAAIYHRDGYADYRTALNVSLTTVTGISIISGQSALATGQTSSADIRWKLSGPESVLSQYAEALKWSSSNPSVLDTVPTTPGTDTPFGTMLKAGNTAGKATVTAQITLGGKTYTARHTYTVTDKAIAVFGGMTAEGFTPINHDAGDTACYQGNLETATGSLLVTVSNASRLTVKSGNAKVITAGKAQAENGAFRIPLTMKAAGAARLILTADDAAKTKTEVLLYVRDPKPNISVSSVTVNKLKTSGSTLFIYPNDGYTVENCTLTGDSAALFEALTPGTETDSYQLRAQRATANGTYQLTVKVTTAETTSAAEGASAKTSYELPLTVKVTEQAPKYKIKQISKANLFYRDLGRPRITVTTEEKLTDLNLTGCDFRLIQSEDDTAYSYTIFPDIAGTITSSCTNKGILMLSFEGYETIQTAFTVGMESKKPKLALDNKTVTLYPNSGVTSARIKVNSGKQPLPLDAVAAALRDADGCSLTQTDGELTVSLADNDTANISGAKTYKAKIALTHDNWTETIALPLTVRLDPGKPALRLRKTSLQLNADTAVRAYDMAETEIFWKNGAWFDPNTDISVSAVNAKSQAVIHEGIVFEQDGNRLLARLNNQDIAAGSYKFKVHAVGMPGTAASLTVKVVNSEPKKAVKLSAKGSIDVLNRSGSFVTVTPSLKSLNGTVTDVALSGDFAHLFQASLSENGKIIIHARETDSNGKEIALITKYNYTVNLILTLQNAEGEATQITAPLRLKLKQSRPKVTAAPKNPVFYSGAYNNVKLTVNAALKGADSPEIAEIKLMNQTDLFDYSNGVLTLRNTGTAIKGKTYSLQFKITFKGQADNEKATVIKVNAKIK